MSLSSQGQWTNACLGPLLIAAIRCKLPMSACPCYAKALSSSPCSLFHKVSFTLRLPVSCPSLSPCLPPSSYNLHSLQFANWNCLTWSQIRCDICCWHCSWAWASDVNEFQPNNDASPQPLCLFKKNPRFESIKGKKSLKTYFLNLV